MYFFCSSLQLNYNLKSMFVFFPHCINLFAPKSTNNRVMQDPNSVQNYCDYISWEKWFNLTYLQPTVKCHPCHFINLKCNNYWRLPSFYSVGHLWYFSLNFKIINTLEKNIYLMTSSGMLHISFAKSHICFVWVWPMIALTTSGYILTIKMQQ